MKTIAIAGLLLASAASLAAQKPRIPPDVSALVRRVEVCAHLAGEFGTDDPERERDLARSWDRSRCDDRFLSRDIKSLRKKYAHRPRVLAPLDEELRRVRVELGVEF